jgi:hypothetical protein
VLRKDLAGVFQRLDRDGIYSSKGVFPVGESSAFVSPNGFIPLQSLYFGWRFSLSDSHFLSLRIGSLSPVLAAGEGKVLGVGVPGFRPAVRRLPGKWHGE